MDSFARIRYISKRYTVFCYNIATYTFNNNAMPNPNMHIAIPIKAFDFVKNSNDPMQFSSLSKTKTAENKSAVSFFVNR